jgi:hypothetical protein
MRRTFAGTKQSGFRAIHQFDIADGGNRLIVQLDGLGSYF